jgi:hypothetical protein
MSHRCRDEFSRELLSINPIFAHCFSPSRSGLQRDWRRPTGTSYAAPVSSECRRAGFRYHLYRCRSLQTSGQALHAAVKLRSSGCGGVVRRHRVSVSTPPAPAQFCASTRRAVPETQPSHSSTPAAPIAVTSAASRRAHPSHHMRRFVLGWQKLGLERSLGTRLVTRPCRCSFAPARFGQRHEEKTPLPRRSGRYSRVTRPWPTGPAATQMRRFRPFARGRPRCSTKGP